MPKFDGNKLPILKTVILDRPRVPFWSELHNDGTFTCQGKERRLPSGLAAEVIHEAGVGRYLVRVWHADQLWYAWLTGKYDFKKAEAKPKSVQKELAFAGYDFTSGPGGTKVRRETIDVRRAGDHGADPLGDGRFRMVPSGDIVDFEERNRRLKR